MDSEKRQICIKMMAAVRDRIQRERDQLQDYANATSVLCLLEEEILAELEKADGELEQLTILERLQPSSCEVPESSVVKWKVPGMARSQSGPDATLGRGLSESTKLQHGLFQELEKKLMSEQTHDSSTPTCESCTSAVQSEQKAPTRAKTLLEIYYEAKAKETDEEQKDAVDCEK
ncbi:hypothetical protein CGRA01v4_07691 [Colletotrichum graminicola]|uniref:Uncharacterized protein n=1 Tax=Colletotrichum graminicola (strain M1.001 / M2 / FGSC 10212) TaxID=645133 RepID=E3QYP3_COLGM|nr:uncharacterized protein GLRG_11125 [Colletotrichum graminicola M1.001]EFQ35981.1 hypothetical protein GLRG_11125 [Colletotrichum graminicola M1.001]WDK16408.1 hypothetical protein CGRA01v4_07691 [Colletotrichum graminicola]